jgi:hypothetical protein
MSILGLADEFRSRAEGTANGPCRAPVVHLGVAKTGKTPGVGSLTCEPVEDVDELRQALRGLGLALNDAVWDAPFDVIPEDGQADAVQRRFGGRQLLEQLDANAWFLDHPANAANLSFDPVQACHETLLLRFVQHRRPLVKGSQVTVLASVEVQALRPDSPGSIRRVLPEFSNKMAGLA